VLDGLGDVDWRDLEHAYGPAADVPGQIHALVSPDAETRRRALSELYQLSSSALHDTLFAE
jgi:hypothetical protein